MSTTATEAKTNDCFAHLEGDTLRMGNSRIERTAVWNSGHIRTVRVVDKKSGKVFTASGNSPDFAVNNEQPTSGTLKVSEITSDGIRPEHLVATISYRLGELEVERNYRIYDNVPAIAVDTRLRGHLNGVADTEQSAADRSNIEHTKDMKVKPVTAILDRLQLPGQHWHGNAVEFHDITDWNNNLVDERKFISYRKTNYRGNILFVADGAGDGGFIFVKEAPCSSVQLNYKNADFIADFGSFAVTGLGINDKDVTPDKWTSTYSSVLCTYGGGELEALTALRSYQKKLRILNPNRDEMVMMNTWGDRSQDSKVNETFCLNELDRAARLGISVFQIDDGWQVGKSPNSAVAQGSFKNIHDNPDYWKPDPVKYPHGLAPIVEKGRKLGIETGLWFNPSVQNDFADWQKDADAITALWKEYGIRVFKIDGLTVTSKKGEENLRKLFDKVLADTGNEVVFNLDATASRRCGYHFFNEYGNIFLENRYTDWGNYYPYWTLRNLWTLARYVPAERLQIEFLNNRRNGDKYNSDPFAPANYDFSYIFAITMAGQPLAWMEASNLKEDAFAIKPLVDGYRKIQHDFHSGTILPIGEEPSGRSWTGFQSLTSETEGYLLVYREDTDRDTDFIETRLPEGANVTLSPVLGSGRKTKLQVGRRGEIKVSLPRANDFALYKYEIKNKL